MNVMLGNVFQYVSGAVRNIDIHMFRKLLKYTTLPPFLEIYIYSPSSEICILSLSCRTRNLIKLCPKGTSADVPIFCSWEWIFECEIAHHFSYFFATSFLSLIALCPKATSADVLKTLFCRFLWERFVPILRIRRPMFFVLKKNNKERK